MSPSLKDLTDEALRLPPDERVRLAETLLLTIDEAQDQKLDEATIQELERRFRDLQEEKVEGIPAAEALRLAREALLRRA
ncbi:MAG TPA: addiction module protein [Chthoniobacterales bacterium]|nr:addiction module protein [Chthoniobacterales bacterium]